METETSTLEKQLERRHTYVTTEETPLYNEIKRSDMNIEGYLFKRGQNAFRTWNRRWFYLEANKVVFFLYKTVQYTLNVIRAL